MEALEQVSEPTTHFFNKSGLRASCPLRALLLILLIVRDMRDASITAVTIDVIGVDGFVDISLVEAPALERGGCGDCGKGRNGGKRGEAVFWGDMKPVVVATGEGSERCCWWICNPVGVGLAGKGQMVVSRTNLSFGATRSQWWCVAQQLAKEGGLHEDYIGYKATGKGSERWCWWLYNPGYWHLNQRRGNGVRMLDDGLLGSMCYPASFCT
eukprot:scaffold68266_cov33-Attheya_sp.AAC.1